MKNELSTFQYMLTTQTWPMTRCVRPPLGDELTHKMIDEGARMLVEQTFGPFAAQAGRRPWDVHDGRLHPVQGRAVAAAQAYDQALTFAATPLVPRTEI